VKNLNIPTEEEGEQRKQEKTTFGKEKGVIRRGLSEKKRGSSEAIGGTL